jgi:FkbM family methyltransferase
LIGDSGFNAKFEFGSKGAYSPERAMIQDRLCIETACWRKTNKNEAFVLIDNSQKDAPFGTFQPVGLVQTILRRTRLASASWFDRRVAFALRRIAIMKLAGKPVDTQALGAKMRIFPYNNVCEKRILFTPQFFDSAELATIKSKLHDGFVFLDIGANIGGYSLFVAANASPNARILAIEPQPNIYERLIFNLHLNSFSTVKALACAVGDKDGDLTLFVDQQNQGESSVKVITQASAGGGIKVPAKRLLTILEEEGITHVDAAKLDTEGAEDIILETFFGEAPQSLWPRILLIERGNSRWHVDLPKLLADLGYKIINQTKNNVIYER